jgi:endonuclease-3
LLAEHRAGGAVAVGALGTVDLPAGWYAYVGSARGPGGFARLDRHARVAHGERAARHWHVDCLLADAATHRDEDRRSPGVDGECTLARRVATALDGPSAGQVVDDFGASDCDCRSHLL